MLSTQKSAILWLWIQTLLYGMYIVLYAVCMRILLSRKDRRVVHKRLLLVITIMFIISTALAIVNFLYAFLTTDVLADGTYPGETESVLREKDVGNLLDVFANALNTANNFVADGLLIWRCFIVWRNRAVTIIPLVMLTVGTAGGMVMVYISAQAYRLRLRLPLSEVTPPQEWTDLQILYYDMRQMYYSASLVTNILVTVLIGGRIIWTHRGLRQYIGSTQSRKYIRLASLIIESGAIYSACLLLAVITQSGNPLSDFAAVGVSGAIVGMASGIFPTLLVVYVGLDRTTEQAISTPDTRLEPSRATTVVLRPMEFAAPEAVGELQGKLHYISQLV